MEKVRGFPAFKISASIIKPARESLLDYCSYCLFVIALTGLSRVWIGGTDLGSECGLNYSGLENHRTEAALEDLHSSSHTTASIVKTFGGYRNFDGKLKESGPMPTGITLMEALPPSVPASRNNFTSLDFWRVKNEYPLRNVVDGNKPASLNKSQGERCSFQDQTVFAYVVLLESSVLLLIGLIWPKVPEVSGTLNKFSKLVHACEKNVWAKKALKVISDGKQSNGFDKSVYSLASDDHTGNDFESLLDTLFHPDNDYQIKAGARHLYERVQILCEVNSNTSTVWTTYVVKSLIQFVLWITLFNINLILFVILEFYVTCDEDGSTPCNGDTFLRIVWFFTETVLMIYAFFNCKTLLWISKKSSARKGSCSNAVNFLTTCRRPYSKHRKLRLIYRFAHNPPVYNDAALLLHLLEETRPETVLYFVVFMFPDWKRKLNSFANSMLETSSWPPIQMISGRPPPVIEIEDLSDEKGQMHRMSSCLISNENRKDSVKLLCIDRERQHKAGYDTRIPGTTGSTDAAIGCNSPNTYLSVPGGVNHSTSTNPCLVHAINNEWNMVVDTIPKQPVTVRGEDISVASSDSTGSSVLDETVLLLHRTSSSESAGDKEVNNQQINISEASETHCLIDHSNRAM